MSLGITGALGTAAAGLAAQSTRIQVSAHNIANANTPGFAPQQVTLAEAPGGLRAIVEPGPDPASGVDLATELIDQLSASRAYEANLAVLRSESERVDALLDVVG